MRLSRRGLILGGSALLAGCASADSLAAVRGAALMPSATDASAVRVTMAAATLDPAPPLDPRSLVRKDLMDRALAALDIHHRKIPQRDRMYLVDFKRSSSEERLFEIDLISGEVKAFRTCHGRGSDPTHSGFAQNFSNTPESYMSSVGAFATAGAGYGAQQGPNVLLDGLEYSNDRARERAIIIHGADYADPDFLAREGKLGRSYGCFSTSHADLPSLRERMGEGRLLFAFA